MNCSSWKHPEKTKKKEEPWVQCNININQKLEENDVEVPVLIDEIIKT